MNDDGQRSNVMFTTTIDYHHHFNIHFLFLNKFPNASFETIFIVFCSRENNRQSASAFVVLILKHFHIKLTSNKVSIHKKIVQQNFTIFVICWESKKLS